PPNARAPRPTRAPAPPRPHTQGARESSILVVRRPHEHQYRRVDGVWTTFASIRRPAHSKRMPRRVAIPTTLNGTAIRTSEANQHHLNRERLRSPDVQHPFHGGSAFYLDLDSVLGLCRAYEPLLADGQFFSHSTAAALYGRRCRSRPCLARSTSQLSTAHRRADPESSATRHPSSQLSSSRAFLWWRHRMPGASSPAS
ncbi:MAG: hypothetical protein JWO10_881, partial [Microbacteriaceae bacterium]|nr:hypothetical protein [Microbacteriaceae bacterium]